jgi:hypothetical protein
MQQRLNFFHHVFLFDLRQLSYHAHRNISIFTLLYFHKFNSSLPTLLAIILMFLTVLIF